MNTQYLNGFFRPLLMSLSLILCSHSYADDTEIFFSESLSGVKHNIMFIIDGSGSMDLPMGDSGDTRLDVMKNALSTVLQNAPDNLNVGLMNYGEDEWRTVGHGVKFPISDINAKALPIVRDSRMIDLWGSSKWWKSSIPEPSSTITVRDYLSEITDWYWKDNWYDVKEGEAVKEMPHKGVTPIVDAIYETALYFRGNKLGFGFGDAGYWNRWAAHPSTYSGDFVEWDEEACLSTYEKTHSPGLDFASGERDWYNCPSSSGTGNPSYANCQTNESCVKVDEWTCDNKIPGYCKDAPPGTESQDCDWQPAVCPSGVWYETKVDSCTYDVCEAGYTPHPNYISPIEQECQNNYIVLLSDGKPDTGETDKTENQTYRNLKSGEMPTLVDKSDPLKVFDHTSCDVDKTPSGFSHGICGPQLSRFLADSDNSDLDGKQSILTYTVGFGLAGEADSENYLKSLVTTDDTATPNVVEGYFSADDEAQLSTAFSEILAQISSSTTSFAAPGYSVNTTTGLSNEQVVYIPVFDKRKTPRWDGNLKKFTLGKDASGKNIIKSKGGTPALDELGAFEDSAQDIWSASASADGGAVKRGGAASLIDPNNRLAISDLNCNSLNCDLTAASNELTTINVNDGSGLITNALLGLASGATEADRSKLINFARGRTFNEKTGVYDVHPRMGDMLHTEPVVITYKDKYLSTANVNTKYNGQVVYAATNEGYLHAFDTTSGKELFAYMPAELLKNINKQYLNTGSNNHAYGIDGNISVWRHDADKDGLITAGGDDKVYLYFGLRRGGRSYYALDVTNPLKPKLIWKLKSTDTHFSNLGQSWSTPYLARIRTSQTELQEVVIFSGGYDLNQDTEDLTARNSVDTMGNDIFIVDALTGDYVWSVKGGVNGSTPITGAAALTHSIPGGARLLDMNKDGGIDRLYFADTNAQVWRLELPMGPSYDLDTAKLIKFAALGAEPPTTDILTGLINTVLGSNNGSDARMIYNEPDIGFLRHGAKTWLTVSVGSGYRAHPANESISDNFYVMLDGAVHTPLVKKAKGTGDFETITLDNLQEISFVNGTLNKGAMANKTMLELTSKVGWYLKLPETGEKVLSNSITSNGSVMFTTLVPKTGAASAVSDPCVAPVTQGRFYSLNIVTGDAGSDLDNDGIISNDDGTNDKKSDLFSVIGSNEIPGTPQLVFNDPSCTGEKCEQIVDIRVGKKSSPVTSYDSAYLEGIFWTNPSE